MQQKGTGRVTTGRGHDHFSHSRTSRLPIRPPDMHGLIEDARARVLSLFRLVSLAYVEAVPTLVRVGIRGRDLAHHSLSRALKQCRSSFLRDLGTS